MCGIAGIKSQNLSQENLRSTISRMSEALKRRGPDGDGTHLADGVALAHRRLSIIDLEGGAQPIYNQDKSLCIVFNGEIYNYRELRKELVDKGYHFNTQSDTEVILHLYEEKGMECVNFLNGIFAFAILESLSGKLFIARDHYGVKPLYYHISPSGDFAFASEMKALAKFFPTRPDIDETALELFLTFEHVPAPYSIYKGCKKLEAGTWLVHENNSARTHRYFSPQFSPKQSFPTEAQALDALDGLFTQAIRRQMVSDVPVGVFLSGGIDSSLITKYMVQASGAQIQSFNVGFEESSFDETEYAQFVAKKMGTKHHTFLFTKSVMQSYAEKIFSQMDEPFADPSFFPSSFLCEHAKPYVKVVLGGDAGDELFGGYPTYYARKISNYFPALPMRVLGHLAQLLPVSDENISFDFKLKKFLGGFETKNADLRHQLWLGAFSPNQAKDILHSGKANGAAAGLMKSHMKDCHFSGWERSQWSDLRFYLQDDMLVKMDRAGMMNGLEVRVPFLDLPLADFALKLPAELKYKGNISKYLLRKLAAKALPSEISERPKKGFGMPVAKWIKSELREGFEAVFSESPAYSSGFFRQDKINSLYREHINGQADHRKLLWPVFVFENWYSKAHKGSL